MNIFKKYSPIKLVYFVSIAVSLLCILCFGPIEYNDTPSYLSAWENWSQGKMDTFRTPLYPMFLGAVKGMTGKAWGWAAILIQYAIFILSVKYFHKMAKMLLKDRAALIVTAIYAIYPTFNSWGNLLLTDSLGMSLSVVFIFAGFKVIMEGSIRHTYIATLMLVLLLALRPASVSMLIPAALSFFLVLFIKEKRMAGILGLAGIAVCSVCLLVYCAKVKEKTGIFTPSTVSAANDLTIARMYGYLLPEAIEDAHLSEVLRDNYEKYGLELQEGPVFYGAIGNLMDEFSVAEMKKAVNNSIRLNPALWFKALVKRFYLASLTPATRSYASDLFRIHPLFPINIGIVILLLTVYSIIIVIQLFSRRFPVANIFLATTSLCVIGVSIIGAQHEYSRLILPAMPCILIVIAQLLENLKLGNSIRLI